MMLVMPVLGLISRSPQLGLIIFLTGISTMVLSTIVHLVTLPVEWDASFKRALPILEAGEYISPKERKLISEKFKPPCHPSLSVLPSKFWKKFPSASNISLIDEPEGRVDKDYKDEYEHWKDSVLSNLSKFGRNTQYNHNINITYRVPINKIPLLDWTNLTSRYNATYNWQINGKFLHFKTTKILTASLINQGKEPNL